MLWTFNTGNPGMKNRLELATIQVSPRALFNVIPAGQLIGTFWTRPLHSRLMLEMNVDLLVR